MHSSQVDDLAVCRGVLNDSRVDQLDQVRVPEAAVRLDLAHGGRDAILARRDQDLLQREEPPAARVPDQVDEGETALAKKLLDLVAPPVNFERRISVC